MTKATCVLYWLYDDRCICPWRHGYIGVTVRLTNRLSAHRRSGHFPNFHCQILFTGSIIECAALEFKMRPNGMIGWNVGCGGNRKSIEQREKMRKRALTRWSDPAARVAHRAIVKAGLAGIDRSGMSNANYGKKTSEAAKQKMRDRIIERGGIANPIPKGSHRTDTEKAAISAGTIAAGPLTPEQRARQIANTPRGEAHWRNKAI